METARQIVDMINARSIHSPHYVEDEVDMSNTVEVDTVDLDEHRWYVLGTVVFRIGREFFGVRGPVSLKSESMVFDDVGVCCEAFEMEEVPSVTYHPKK
jgi:hypothetical protein